MAKPLPPEAQLQVMVRVRVSRMVMDSIGAEGCPKVRVRVRVMVRAIVSVRTRDRVR